MSDKTQQAGISIGFGGALFLLFLGLRLTDHIDWAWYWVAAPLWVPAAIVFAIVIVVAGIFLGIAGIAWIVGLVVRCRVSGRS